MMHSVWRKPVLWVMVLAVLAVDAYAADMTDTDGAPPTDKRIRLLPYDANTVYTVSTRIGYQTYIEFSPREDVQTISIGERSYWQLIPAENRLFIRPLRPGVATNMTIITNRHAYQFDLASADEFSGDDADESSSKKAVRRPGNVDYVVRFVYPDLTPKPQAATPPATIAAPAPVTISPLPPSQAAQRSEPAPVTLAPAPVPILAPTEPARNYLYTYSGPDAEAPYEIFDDGTTTYFRYTDSTHPAPRVAAVDAAGVETPLSVFKKDDYYAVNAVTTGLILRANGSTVAVYNDAFAPGGRP